MSSKRFRIAFSFAGEKREFVAQVADILAKRFGEDAILYDKFHEAEFSRSDLAFYLPDLYEKESELIVAIFCPEYDKKEWCGLEWNAIFGLLKSRQVIEIMLARFKHVEGRGLRGLAGFIELDHKTPEQAANLILERLALNKKLHKDCYKNSFMSTREQTERFATPKLPNSKKLLEVILNHPVVEERGLTEILESPVGLLEICYIPNTTAAGTAWSVKKSILRPVIAELRQLGWLLPPEEDDKVRIYELNPESPSSVSKSEEH